MRQVIRKHTQQMRSQYVKAVSRIYNYALENVMGVDKPFRVRMVVKYDNKYAGQMDTDVVGQRTMISDFRDLKTSKVRLKAEGISVKNVKITALKK